VDDVEPVGNRIDETVTLG